MTSNKKRDKTPSVTTILFVYGTLKRGQRNHRLMREARFLGETVTAPQYTLLDLGPFPGMITGGTTAVHGELYEVGPELLARLDRHEGVPRFYVRESIHVVGNAKAESYILVDLDRLGRSIVMERGCWTFGIES
jgi:gamma-glutamylcyclotransferase (GGCT)/AIG2-like uncharacterized protein YtfP